ncbi:hypothetical protein [Bacillus sp. R86525]|uniref:hypothetical protein n=1 Tax=Bacillus sp. R86525 TaxID=3101709 RepID=UPI00366DFCFD
MSYEYVPCNEVSIADLKESRLSRYLWAVKLLPQNSTGAKKLGGSPAARKCPIGEG